MATPTEIILDNGKDNPIPFPTSGVFEFTVIQSGHQAGSMSYSYSPSPKITKTIIDIEEIHYFEGDDEDRGSIDIKVVNGSEDVLAKAYLPRIPGVVSDFELNNGKVPPWTLRIKVKKKVTAP